MADDDAPKIKRVFVSGDEAGLCQGGSGYHADTSSGEHEDAEVCDHLNVLRGSHRRRTFEKSVMRDDHHFKWRLHLDYPYLNDLLYPIISSPRMVPVLLANLSSSIPMRWSMETKRFGSG